VVDAVRDNEDADREDLRDLREAIHVLECEGADSLTSLASTLTTVHGKHPLVIKKIASDAGGHPRGPMRTSTVGLPL
jgi:hypothetical protein